MFARQRRKLDLLLWRCGWSLPDKEALTDRSEAHERSTIYKWMQLVVDTSIVHAILYRSDAAEHRPQQKSGACIVQFLDHIVLRLSCNRTGARSFINVVFATFWILL